VVDSAAIRRFNIKLEFDYLKPEGSLAFYKLFMKTLVNEALTDKELAELASVPLLTPGDFKVVYQKYSFFDKKDLSHHLLIKSLQEEIRSKSANAGKVMGFSAIA
jgi:hypothetical protein